MPIVPKPVCYPLTTTDEDAATVAQGYLELSRRIVAAMTNESNASPHPATPRSMAAPDDTTTHFPSPSAADLGSIIPAYIVLLSYHTRADAARCFLVALTRTITHHSGLSCPALFGWGYPPPNRPPDPHHSTSGSVVSSSPPSFTSFASLKRSDSAVSAFTRRCLHPGCQTVPNHFMADDNTLC